MKKFHAAALVMALFTSPLLAQTQSPAQPPAPSVIGQFVRGITPGTHVTLKLTDGTRVKGMLVTSEDDAVTVKPRARIPEPMRRVMLSDIADANVGGGSTVAKSAAIGAAVGAGAALGVMFLLVLLYGGD
jgi:hypothetical protein